MKSDLARNAANFPGYRTDFLLKKTALLASWAATSEQGVPVVIKQLLEKGAADAATAWCFSYEVELLQSLQQVEGIPALVDVHDSYFVLRYIDGISLRTRLRLGGCSFRRGLTFVVQLATIIQQLHAKGIIHRDLKPENIILDRTGRLHLIDFSAAVRPKDVHRFTVLEHSFIGSPFYISPEQDRDPSSANDSSDLYSLAVMTYELLHPSPLVGRIKLNEIPKTVRPILKQALHPDGKDRHPSVEVYARQLNEVLAESAEEPTSFSLDAAFKEEHLASLYRLFPLGSSIFSAGSGGVVSFPPAEQSGLLIQTISRQDGCIGALLIQSSSPGGSAEAIATAILSQKLLLEMASLRSGQWLDAVIAEIGERIQTSHYSGAWILLDPHSCRLEVLRSHNFSLYFENSESTENFPTFSAASTNGSSSLHCFESYQWRDSLAFFVIGPTSCNEENDFWLSLWGSYSHLSSYTERAAVVQRLLNKNSLTARRGVLLALQTDG